MAYTPTEWACGDIVTAEKLNAIERGISEVNSEYVPTEWQCGDVITAEAMNKIEQGIANAEGGGECDFSTATVTFVNSVSGKYYSVVCLPIIENDELLVDVLSQIDVSTEQSAVIPLYKGSYTILFPCFTNADSGTMPSVSGSATVDLEKGIIVTGDCTITLAGASD